MGEELQSKFVKATLLNHSLKTGQFIARIFRELSCPASNPLYLYPDSELFINKNNLIVLMNFLQIDQQLIPQSRK